MELNSKTMRKIIFLIVIAILLFLGLQNFSVVMKSIGILLGLLMPLLLGFCIAFILNVLMKIIEERLFAPLNKKNYKIWNSCRRPLCLILTISIVIAVILILLFLLIPELKKTFDIMLNNLPLYLKQIQTWLEDIVSSLDISADTLAAMQIDWKELEDSIRSFSKNVSSHFLTTTFDVTASIFSGLVNFILGVAFSIYILLQKEKLGKQIKKTLYAFLPEEKADIVVSIGVLSNKTFSRFVSGQFLEAIIIGVLCFIGMQIFSMPYASMISVLVGFTALIPMVGAFIGTAIGAFLILMVDPMKAFWFIIFIIVLQQFEGNVIYPRVVGSSVGLSGLWVLFAIMIGGSAFGIVGMLISVPVCSVLYCLLRTSVAQRLDDKGITIE